MLNRILNFFRQQENDDVVGSKELQLEQFKKGLAILKEREARFGDNAPLELINQIEDVEMAIQLTDQVIKGEISEREWEQRLQPLTIITETTGLKTQPSEVSPVSLSGVRESLDSIKQTHKQLSEQTSNISGDAKTGSVDLLNQAEQQITDLEDEILEFQAEPPQEVLVLMDGKISRIRQNLSILVRRRTFQRNLQVLEKQLAQENMTEETLQPLLGPTIVELQENIDSLEQEESLNSHEQRILESYRHNLELCQQMLSGERQYATLTVWNQIDMTKESLNEIDASLATMH